MADVVSADLVDESEVEKGKIKIEFLPQELTGEASHDATCSVQAIFWFGMHAAEEIERDSTLHTRQFLPQHRTEIAERGYRVHFRIHTVHAIHDEHTSAL